jgi:acylglycerol lipase
VGAPYWIIFTHGLGEHLDRHNYLLGLFSSNFNILQYDTRGHGQSGGERVNVDEFLTFCKDLAEIIQYIQKIFHGEKIILVGHSMGALITAGLVQHFDQLLPQGPYPQSVFLSAPPIRAPGVLGGLLHKFPKVLRELSQMKFSVPLGGQIDLKFLSHDKRVIDVYKKDPLNQLKIHSHLLLSIVNFAHETFSKPLGAKCPVACAYGSSDGIIDAVAAAKYFKDVDPQIKVFVNSGAYHEMHLEIEKYRKPYFHFLTSFIEENRR